jgi:hypothetical protein
MYRLTPKGKAAHEAKRRLRCPLKASCGAAESQPTAWHGRHAPIHPRTGHDRARAGSRFIGTGCMCHDASRPAALAYSERCSDLRQALRRRNQNPGPAPGQSPQRFSYAANSKRSTWLVRRRAMDVPHAPKLPRNGVMGGERMFRAYRPLGSWPPGVGPEIAGNPFPSIDYLRQTARRAD